MSVAQDLSFLQIGDNTPNTVIGFGSDGEPALFGLFEEDEIGLVPAPTALDLKKVLFAEGWGDLATNVSDNELVRWEADSGAFVGIEMYSEDPGVLMLGNDDSVSGELQIASGTDASRKLYKRYAFDQLANTLDLTVVTDIPNNSVVLIKFIGAGITETTSPGAEAFGGEVAAVFRKNNSGTLSQVGADQSSIPIQHNQGSGAPSLTFTIASNNIQISVDNGGAPVGTYRIIGWIEYTITTITV
jgi:hypothetical protein